MLLLGQSLGKTITAEGIETAEQMEILRAMGCDAGQGYHLARPLSASMLESLLPGWMGQRSASGRAPGSRVGAAMH